MRTEISNQTEQSELMRRYLLGLLPEAEQLDLEARFFADGETLEQIWASENELIDAYVRNRLTAAERAQFERHYLAAPEHRERVAFAQELLRAADEAGAEERSSVTEQAATPAQSFWTKLMGSLRAPQLAFGAMAALLVLLFAGGAWLISERLRWRAQLEQAQTERAAAHQRARELAAQIAQQQERNIELSRELERLREEQRRALAATSPAAKPVLLSFLLLATVRGGSEQPVLKIPPGTAQVRLQMRLERNDYPRYRASLRPVDGGAAWDSASVSITSRKDGTVVSVRVPTARLIPGDYILTLTGVDASGAAEQSNRYFFRVSE